jgi:hypothetical protein
MKLDPNFVGHRKITKSLDCGEIFARRPGSSRTHDLIVAAALLALLVAAIVTRATISSEIADSSVDRQSYVAFVIDVVATLGLSIGLAWLLFSSRPALTMKERCHEQVLLSPPISAHCACCQRTAHLPRCRGLKVTRRPMAGDLRTCQSCEGEMDIPTQDKASG